MLELCTGSRLHFGLMELAPGQPHRFAGLGLMVEMPRLRVRLSYRQRSDRRERLESSPVTEPEISTRLQATLEHVQRTLGRTLRHECALDVVERPALHAGLGLGTQLAAAVAAAVVLALAADGPVEAAPASALADALGAVAPGEHARSGWRSVAQAVSGGDPDQVRELARVSGRGKRSAIGLHGFLYGGLVQDLGYAAPPAALGDPGRCEPQPRPISTRSLSFPSDWPVVLILTPTGGDMHGATEESLIVAAGSQTNLRRERMLELSDRCWRSTQEGDFDGFTTALEEYMNLAASLFAPVQAGRYRDAEVARRVELANAAGLRGVGQSSWGPTVFGFACQPDAAQRAADRLRGELPEAAEVLVTQAANHGASWRAILPGVQHAG